MSSALSMIGNAGAASNDLLGGGKLDRKIQSGQSAWAEGVSADLLASAKSASGRDFTMSDEEMANARDSWNRYRTTFQPLEDQAVKDAAGYDSPAEMERVRQAAAGNANAAFDTAQESRGVSLSRMGVNPNSGRFADPTALATARTTGVADSMNRATADRQDKAIQLRQQIAQFGLNMPSMGDRAYQTAIGATGAGTAAMNAAAGVGGTIQTQPAAWSNAGTAASGTGANIELQNTAMLLKALKLGG